MIKAVILDVDGTLIDSNDAHANSWEQALRDFGYNVPYTEIRTRIGKGGDRLLPEVSGIEEDSSEGKQIANRRKDIFNDRYLADLKPFPGTRDLLLQFKAEGLKLVVGSSSDGATLQKLLERAGVEDLIDATTSKDDAESSKPSPDIVEAALKSAGVHPDEAVMLGDTPYDIEAAHRAGVRAIALTCGGWDPKDLGAAAAIHRDPADLLERLKRFAMNNQHSRLSGLEPEVHL